MSWSVSEKKWADEMLRAYYSGMSFGTQVSAENIQVLVFGESEEERKGAAIAYARDVIRPRLEMSLNALDEQAEVVESEMAEILAS